MAKINILPASVYNRIAAGEVVDRPYSVVKELVENSIDAGATEIEIYVEKGGKQLVRVVDNGSGIEREDLQSAFLPHATSKLSTAEELADVLTLGFRGEAIASISSVSQMTITSQTETGKCYSLFCDGGQLGQITEAAGSGRRGTDVRVEMLFYHTPVRLAFLKSDKVEETEITNYVSRFILNRSDIAFTYYVDGKKILQSFGGGDEEAMACVYGATTLAQCYCINAEKHGVRIRGYIGNQNFFKANKSYQSVFLNGRYVVNATIAAALSNAYASYIMKRQFPFYVLHIDLPAGTFDVNMHPNKADVRLTEGQIVYGCVYSVISAVLDGHTKALDYVVKMPTVGAEEGYVPFPKETKTEETVNVAEQPVLPTFTYEQAKKEIEKSAPMPSKKPKIELPFEEVAEDEEEDEEENKPADYPKGYIPAWQIGPFDPEAAKQKAAKEKGLSLRERFPDLYFDDPKVSVKEGQKEDGFEANKRFLEDLERKKKQSRIDIHSCTYVGKLFNTYILYEKDDDVYLIDQHAAHERLIYDRLKSRIGERVVVRQPMLVPFNLRLNAFETQFINEQLPAITEMGFTLTQSADTEFEITEIPLDLQGMDLGVFFNEILGNVSGFRAIKLEHLLKEKLAMAACKAAVKGGMDLTCAEIDALFAMMDGDMGLKCPHGRPVVVKLTKTELEKLFKRIV